MVISKHVLLFQYAIELAKFVEAEKIPNLKVWTSELRRTVQTARYIDAPKEHWKALNEIDAVRLFVTFCLHVQHIQCLLFVVFVITGLPLFLLKSYLYVFSAISSFILSVMYYLYKYLRMFSFFFFLYLFQFLQHERTFNIIFLFIIVNFVIILCFSTYFAMQFVTVLIGIEHIILAVLS